MDKTWNDLLRSWNGLLRSWNDLSKSWTWGSQKRSHGHTYSVCRTLRSGIDALHIACQDQRASNPTAQSLPAMAEEAAAFLARAKGLSRAPSEASFREGRDNHDADDYDRREINNAYADTLPEPGPYSISCVIILSYLMII